MFYICQGLGVSGNLGCFRNTLVMFLGNFANKSFVFWAILVISRSIPDRFDVERSFWTIPIPGKVPCGAFGLNSSGWNLLKDLASHFRI